MKTTIKQKQDEFRIGVCVELHRLFELRRSQGLSATTVAARCGVSVTSIRRRLCGKQNLTLATVGRLLAALDYRGRLEFAPSKALTMQTIESLRAEPVLPPASDVHGVIATCKLPKLSRESVAAGHHETTVKAMLHCLAGVGFEWIGHRKLAGMVGLSHTLLCPMLRAMERAKLIEIHRRPKTGTPHGQGLMRYRVRVETLRMLTSERRSA